MLEAVIGLLLLDEEVDVEEAVVAEMLLLFALLVTLELAAFVTLFVATEVVLVVTVVATISGWGADFTARSSRSCTCSRQNRNNTKRWSDTE